MSEPCLHCKMQDVIEQHFRDKGMVSDGKVIIDVANVLENSATVIAEILASANDRRMWDKLVKNYARAIRDEIPNVRARGDGYFPEPIRKH